MSTFDVKQPFLQDVLRNIGNGSIQLPDFQRAWVWDDYHIRSIIASVSQSFPIGVVLALEADGIDIRFKTRVLEGVNSEYTNKNPEILILDGQQRLTALFQALMSGRPVSTRNTRGNDTLRYYFLDMEACVRNEIEREEAVLSCREDRRLQTVHGKIIDLHPIGDLLSINSEYINNMFPVDKIFDSAAWRREYSKHWDHDSDKIELFDEFEGEIIDRFKQYNIPVIQLHNETPKEAVCLVFEKVNTRGVTLTVFELLTASFAVDNFDLRDDWDSRFERMKVKFPVLAELESSNFLRSLTLLTTNANSETAISCTRRDILRLTLEDYKKWADHVEDGFVEAARFLHRQKIFNARDLPYQTHLVPLAAILTNLGDLAETKAVQQKIARWYWCGVLGEMYGAATDTRFANDLSEVTDWVKNTAKEPRTIQEANFQENRLPELRTRNGAAYKGVHALIMHDRKTMKCSDFRTAVPIDEKIYFDDNIDIHHIFPKAWCEKQDIKPNEYNSIINKTALAASTNRKIGSDAPSEYLSRIQNEAQIRQTTMDDILASHLICPNTLRNDDFCGFFKSRKEALLEAIEKAMGKKVIREGDDPQIHQHNRVR